MLSSTSRHVFLISAAVGLLVGGLGRTAAAKDCTTDSDCGTGYQCVIGGSGVSAPAGGASGIGSGTSSGSEGVGGAGGSTASSGAGPVVGISCPGGSTCDSAGSPPTKTSVPAADAGAAPQPIPSPPPPVPAPVATGTCEAKPIVCTSVADCPSADFDCVMETADTSGPTCSSANGCTTSTPQTGTSGTCVAKLHACSTVADCPAPLICQAEYSICSGGGSVGADGIVNSTTESCTSGPSVCTWVPTICTTDSDCADPLYQCVTVSQSSACTGGSTGDCASGQTCPPTPLPSCSAPAIMNCLPKLVDCASGQACPAGWSCFDFSNLGGIPPAWGSVASNQACLPAGIIFAAQGHAAGGSQVTESSGSNAGSSGTGSMALGPGNGTGGKVATATATATATTTATATGGFPGGAAPSPTNQAPPAQAAPTASADAGVAPAAMVQSSGCAYGGSDASQVNPWLALAMAGLVARLARRRNRAG